MWLPRTVRFFRSAYRDNRLRLDGRRRLTTDLALYGCNRLLSPWERFLVHRSRITTAPVCFIVGVPRSGTTLLHQLLASRLNIGYITNRIARYWMAPLWATRRHFPSAEARAALTLESDLGVAAGEAAPHEFGYFWQFHFEPGEHDRLPAGVEGRRRCASAARELTALAAYHGTGLLLKNPTYTDLNIPTIAEALPSSRFLYIHRDARFVARSLLRVRRERYGDPSFWWSVRPPGFETVVAEEPATQVAFQIESVSHAIESALDELDDRRVFELSYESLVERPVHWLGTIGEWLGVPPSNEGGMRVPPLFSANLIRENEVRDRVVQGNE